jgi:hypothetical protein
MGHPRPRLRLVPLVSALVLLTATAATACGGEDGPTASTGTRLVVAVDPGDGSSSSTWTLRCDPAGGDHPDPTDACAWLASVAGLEPDPFDPVAPDLACTEIYGGPQTAAVTGTLEGQQVDAAFSRQDGCEIARWDTALPLLVEPGGI